MFCTSSRCSNPISTSLALTRFRNIVDEETQSFSKPAAQIQADIWKSGTRGHMANIMYDTQPCKNLCYDEVDRLSVWWLKKDVAAGEAEAFQSIFKSV